MMKHIFKHIRHKAFKGLLATSQSSRYQRLLDASKTPHEAQSSALNNILRSNALTDIGMQYDFASISNPADFRKTVPIHNYEDLRERIELQESKSHPSLTAEQPIYYQRSSGTTGKPKHIPVTSTGLSRIKDYQRLAAYRQSKYADVFLGKIFGVTGKAEEGRMLGNTPLGAASGMIYQQQSRLVKSKYVLPACVSEIEDYQSRYLVMATLGAAEHEVTAVSTANPSTLVKLLDVLNDNIDIILSSIEEGALHSSILVDSQLRDEINSKLSPDAIRSNYLRRIVNDQRKINYQDIWPTLKGIVTWTGGSCQVPLSSLKSQIPDNTQIIELGYVSSEFRGTINIDCDRGLCIPTLEDNYFEFVQRQKWEEGEHQFIGLEEIEEEQEYYLFVTTPDGLYRYDMNDIVRVSGWVNQTPCFSFVRKGQGVTSITGEKLHEDQVITAVLDMCKHHQLTSDFFMMLADVHSAQYSLYLEADNIGPSSINELASDLNHRIGKLNIEYGEKYESGRLNPLTIQKLKGGTSQRYREELVKAGQRDAQFKQQCLQFAHECKFDFQANLETTKAL